MPESAPGPEYTYDVFISYSHHDEGWVREWLLPRLEGAGLRVCIDFRDFEVGVPSLVNMERAAQRSRRTTLVLTPDWVASEWTNFEALMLQTEDPIGLRRRVLPLMLKDCQLPPRLKIFTYADFRSGANWEAQFQRLLDQVGGALSGPTLRLERGEGGDEGPGLSAPDARPVWTILVVNLILLALATLAIASVVPGACVAAGAQAFAFALVGLELVHLVVRFGGEHLVRSVVKLGVNIGILRIETEQPAQLLAPLHPATLSDRVFWVQFVLALVVAGAVGWPAVSPFRRVQVAKVQHFLVHHVDGSVEQLPPGGLLRLTSDTSVQVEAVIAGLSDAACSWAATRGSPADFAGCATLYLPALEGRLDTLSVSVESPCKGARTFAGLHVEIIDRSP
jgi:hypothetical protein